MAMTLETARTEEPEANPHRIDKWAAIAGRWEFRGVDTSYLGPEPTETALPFGLALAGSRFRDGRISTQIKLERNRETTAGVVIGYQSFDAPYVVAALGAYEKAYAISEYRPGLGWFSLAAAGRLSNLDPEVLHKLVVDVSGQQVGITVNDVEVLKVVVGAPLQGTGLGVYAWGEVNVQFRDTSLESSVPRIFVVMPFSEPFDSLYEDVIRPVSQELGFQIIRVDEIPGPGIILDDIQRQIEKAHVVVAEISTRNPNVFYELGYAHALRKPAVLLVRREESGEMPFDVRGYRAIFYDDTIGGKKNVERNLKQHLRAVLNGT